ncbi:hypothetical protein [Streptomyces sp. NPDC000851]
MLISAEGEAESTQPEDVRTALDELLSARDHLIRRLLGTGGVGEEDGAETEDEADPVP